MSTTNRKAIYRNFTTRFKRRTLSKAPLFKVKVRAFSYVALCFASKNLYKNDKLWYYQDPRQKSLHQPTFHRDLS